MVLKEHHHCLKEEGVTLTIFFVVAHNTDLHNCKKVRSDGDFEDTLVRLLQQHITGQFVVHRASLLLECFIAGEFDELFNAASAQSVRREVFRQLESVCLVDLGTGSPRIDELVLLDR